MEKRYELLNREIVSNLFTEDFLGTKVYAKELKDKINEYLKIKRDKPLYIGIIGQWGSGKTSIVNTVLDEMDNKKSIIKIEYDAWKYSGDSFRRNFLSFLAGNKTIVDMGVNTQKHLDRLYKDKVVEGNSLIENIITFRDRDFKLNKNQMIIGIIITLVILFAVSFISISFVKNEIAKILGIVISTLGWPVVAPLMWKTLFKKTTITYPRYFSAEQFYDAVEEILTDSKIENYSKIIFIDNIDRCGEDDLKETFTSVKGLLEISGSIIYIIPFDKEAIKRIYNDGYYGFVNKTFDSIIDVNQCNETDIIDFISELRNKFSDYKDLLCNDVIEVISSETYSSPREIIDICNNYITEYNMFIEKNEFDPNRIGNNQLTFLIKYTIIKNKYCEFYKKIIENIECLDEIDEISVTKASFAEAEKEVLSFKFSPDLFSFMRKTRLIKSNNPNIYFYNDSGKSFNLSTEIQAKIISEQYGDVYEYIDKNGNAKVLQFIEKTISSDLKKGMWKINFRNKFLLISEMMKIGKIKYDDIKFMDAVFKDENFYAILLNNRILDFSKVIDFLISSFEYNKYVLEKIIKKIASFPEDQMSYDEKKQKLNYAFSLYPSNHISEDMKPIYTEHLKKLVDEDAYQGEDNVYVFNKNLLRYIGEELTNRILNNLRLENPNVVNKIMGELSEAYKDSITNDVFLNFILILNKINAQDINYADATKSILKTVLQFCNQPEKSQITDRIDVDFNNLNSNLEIFNLAYKIFVKIGKENAVLKRYIIGCRNEEQKILILTEMSNCRSIPNDYISRLYIDYISNFADSDFDKYKKEIAYFFSSNSEIQEDFASMIFAKSKVIIEVIFNELIDTNSKYNFITLLTSKVNTFEDKIKLITLYETNAQMSSQLVSDIEDLTQLYEMYSICNKKTTKNKIIKRMERLVEISDVLTLEDAKLIEKIGNDVLITKEDKDLLIKGISNKSPQEQRAEL